MTDYKNTLSIYDEMEEFVNEQARAISLRFLSIVVRRTPKKTGRAMGNWYVGVTRPVRAINPNRREQEAITQGTTKIESAQSVEFPTIFISNNLPYIGRLNEGYSDQAPALFVETAFKAAQNT